MLRYLRKNMRWILIGVAAAFIVSVFYGLSFQGVGERTQQKKIGGFLKINGKEVDPYHYSRIFNNLKANFPGRLSPQETLYLQSMAISQAVDFTLMLEEAKKEVRISGTELSQTLEQIAKSQKLASVSQLRKILQRSGVKWSDFKRSIKEEMLVQKLLTKKQQEAKLTANDLREVKARHILIRYQKGKENEVKRRVEKIYKKVLSGGDFAKLAKEYSEDPGTKDKGGDLGYFSTGTMLKPFEETVFKLKIGEVNPPIKTDFGYHIIKLEDSRLRKIKGKEGKDIEKVILQEKQQKLFSGWIYDLKKNAKIEIIDPGLRALDLRLKGKLNEAVLEYKKAIQQNPRSPYLHIFLGNLYEELKKDELAVGEYKKAVDLSSGNPIFYILLGDLYVKMKKTSDAVKQYRKASLISGDNKSIHEELLAKFKGLKSSQNIQNELKEIARIDKKESFERALQEKQQKLKTD